MNPSQSIRDHLTRDALNSLAEDGYDIYSLETAWYDDEFGLLIDDETCEAIRKATREEAVESYNNILEEGLIYVEDRVCYVRPDDKHFK